jgi:Leucine-rich repeat (LRR) protein
MIHSHELILSNMTVGFYKHSGLQKVYLQGQEAIDLTDNDIAILGNFPLSPHLTTLLLARNRISNIQPTLSRSIPNLTNLSLSQNRISNLVDLEPLVALKKLKHLSLLDNPITSKEVLPSSRCVRVKS